MPELKIKQLWQEALSDLVTDPKELLTLLELDLALLGDAEAAAKLFPLKVPRGFLARIEKGNPHDPLLKQILPLGAELQVDSSYQQDPLQERKVNPVPGLLHKYHGRVLVTLTGACAIHCRFCFRRNFPYENNNPGTLGWEKIFRYIAADPSITEVILSGGDPLAVSEKLLKQFSDQLSLVPQIKRLRIHTRVPVVLPERITHEFIEWASGLPVWTIIVIHTNHPNEIDEKVISAMFRLRANGIHVLNQSVLLKGVNDEESTLIALSEGLFSAGVLPYYLHALDKVQGTAHFNVEKERALALHAAMVESLPGYLVPKLVMEEPGKKAKTWLCPQ